MIVVDTTIWIEFLAGRGTLGDLHLVELIESGSSVALTELVYCEVLQGIREDVSFQRVRSRLREFPILESRGLETFEHAAQLFRGCRRKGLTIRRTSDCLIAAVCIEHGAELLHGDREFDAIAKVHPLRIRRIAPD